MTDFSEKITGAYDTYTEEFLRQKGKQKPMDGLFGLRGGAKDYPCHEKFREELPVLLKEMAAASPSSDETEEILRYICFTAPARWQAEPSVHLMLEAVQGECIDLIPYLDPMAAGAIAEQFRSVYPGYRRLPCQKQLLKALECRKGSA